MKSCAGPSSKRREGIRTNSAKVRVCASKRASTASRIAVVADASMGSPFIARLPLGHMRDGARRGGADPGREIDNLSGAFARSGCAAIATARSRASPPQENRQERSMDATANHIRARRTGVLGRALTGVAALALLAAAAPAEAQTIRAVKHSALRVLDPIITTAYMSRNHGYMIFDTLVALDENFEVRPQMAESWEVSEDGTVYRITLRDGLMFHDGEPVRPADVIASIQRWGERDAMGQKLMDFVDTMEADGDKVVVINLKEPYGLVMDSLAKPSSNVPFIMPARLAETPSTEPIPEQIGSGPFKWVAEDFQPGVKA